MADNDDDVLGAALREMEEETGINPNIGEMIDLTREFYKGKWNGIYPSPGACDEVVRLFLYRQKASEAEVKKLQGRRTGLADENEHLKLRIVKLEDLCRITADVKAHSAYMMYASIKQKGAIWKE